MTTPKFARRVANVKPSATLALNARTSELQAAGKNIISLTVGEPDFDTPDYIKAAAIKAIESGFTKYTDAEGTRTLRQAICDKFERENNLHYQPNQIIVSNGAKQSLYNIMQALIDEGDEVIIPAPYWVSYPAMVDLASGTSVFVETTLDTHFKLTPQQLSRAITPKTKIIILNSPSNPTGMAYSHNELKALGDVLAKHPQIIIVTDDIYEHVLWEGKFCNILNACPDLYDRTIIVNGVSKAYSMTGWRIGYCAGDVSSIKAMTKIQSHATSNPCSISQAAAEAALTGDQSYMKTMCSAFKRRHDLAVEALNAMPGIQCPTTDGTFYLFPKVTDAIARFDGMKNSVEFSEYLLTDAGCAVVPGEAFGTPGHIRLSIALSDEKLAQALGQMAEALAVIG